MGEVSFSSVKPNQQTKLKPKVEEAEKVKIMQPDTSWFRKECHQCPCIVKNDTTQTAMCGRPAGEQCLAEGFLVQELIFKQRLEKLLEMQRTMETKVSPIKHKKIKRRR